MSCVTEWRLTKNKCFQRCLFKDLTHGCHGLFFTCRENKQLVAHPVHYYILLTRNLRQYYEFNISHIYLSSYPLQHLANGSISALSWGKTDSLFMLKHVAHPVLFALATQQHVVCSNSLYFIRSTLPFQLLQGLNTFIQVNIMGARHNMYIQTHTGWGGQSWTIFCGPAAVAVGGCERKD